MLFTKASEYLVNHIGPPTASFGLPRRERVWVLTHRGSGRAVFEVKLLASLTQDSARLTIHDPYAGVVGSDEDLTVAQESDLSLALARVRAHMEV